MDNLHHANKGHKQINAAACPHSKKPLDRDIENYNKSMGIITGTLSSRYAMETKELEQENAKLKETLAELKNLCTKEQLAELEYIQKRKGEK